MNPRRVAFLVVFPSRSASQRETKEKPSWCIHPGGAPEFSSFDNFHRNNGRRKQKGGVWKRWWLGINFSLSALTLFRKILAFSCWTSEERHPSCRTEIPPEGAERKNLKRFYLATRSALSWCYLGCSIDSQ